MAQEVEIEFKNLLNKAEYHHLADHFRSHKFTTTEQINHYFETYDFQLKKHHAALRIREKARSFQLTLKQPNPKGAGLLETHADLTETEMNEWISGNYISKTEIQNALNAIQIHLKDLKYGGMLKTFRMEINYKDTLLVLDKSEYNNQTDYELELEAQEEKHGYKVFNEILNEHQIPKRSTANKIERFYQSLNI
ncbi:adenylate cyclase [Gracilibacillus boraciitolerans JCM 21714]|uniref:Adenylate cyclase n=1 Tax=Gracilibacillus boraciitolerans JCM 21714 TaxID=1298598 RepID=W4VM52_9BACI|nr:CYTH domain-containing protein [Gracilibacillus boraciitolerans]GAE94287.1 adenylate cyclase [Gracilibacillus boraciitolerans JCM 21714]